MKANNTLNVSDLTNWINFQLSTIIEGISAGYTLGNNNTVWIDRGATVFTVSLATGEEIEIDSNNYATAEDIAKAIISAVNKNTPTTSDTMNTETKTMNEAKTNTLTLSKCAYIFHWSNSIYFSGTREQIAHKAAVNRALKAVYEDPAKGVNLPYVMENNRAYIELDGLKIDVCDTMLQSISGEYPNAEIVNGRTFKDLTPFYESFKPGTFTRFNACADGQQYFWGAKLKSIEFEAFPSPDGLRFYRLHFRGNSLVLIASNGKIYNAGGSTYNEMTTGDVLHRLDAESKAAKIILTKFIKYIKE